MKGVSEIISAVLVIAIAISLVTLAYTWGIPLIQKRMGETAIERIHTYFHPMSPNSLQRKITETASRGGETIFSLDVEGIWTINTTENSIEFKFFSKVTRVAPNVSWIPVFGYTSICEPVKGQMGVDLPHITCARAERLGEGFDITYKIWFRNMEEPSPSVKKQRIKLVPISTTSSTSKYLRISRGEVYTDPSDPSITLIEIKINLE